MGHPPKTSRPDRRRAVILPLVAVLLPVLMVCLGFSIDLAYMQNTRLEVRAATDAAVRAAASELARTDDTNAARAKALAIAAANRVAGRPLRLRNEDVQFGRSTRAGAARSSFAVGATPFNAVRVNASRQSGQGDGAVPLFFGAFVSARTFEPRSTAVAGFRNVDICLVLDRSSSMKINLDAGTESLEASLICVPPTPGSRWYALDAAVMSFLDLLDAAGGDERVGVATYAGSPPGPPIFCGTNDPESSLDRPLTTDLGAVRATMGTLRSTTWNGLTYIEAGVRTGLAAVTDPWTSRLHTEKVLIVLTDGHQNVGDVRAAVPECVAANVVVHTITLDSGADKALMREVADLGGGRHFHANGAASLEEAFADIAAQLTQLTE